MSYSDDIAKWQSYAESKGIKKSVYRAPIDKFLERLGCNCSPSLFWKFQVVAVVLGVPFGIFWGAFMYFWLSSKPETQILIIDSSLAGLFFGISMAWIHLRTRKKWGLTNWENFKRNN